MKVRVQKSIPYPLVGQWHFIFAFHPAWWRHHGYLFQFGFFRLKQLPPEGEMFQKHHYQGFWLKWEFELPTFGWAHNFKRRND